MPHALQRHFRAMSLPRQICSVPATSEPIVEYFLAILALAESAALVSCGTLGTASGSVDWVEGHAEALAFDTLVQLPSALLWIRVVS